MCPPLGAGVGEPLDEADADPEVDADPEGAVVGLADGSSDDVELLATAAVAVAPGSVESEPEDDEQATRATSTVVDMRARTAGRAERAGRFSTRSAYGRVAADEPDTRRAPVSTASKALAGMAFNSSRSEFGHLSSAAPWKYHGEPLSASTRP